MLPHLDGAHRAGVSRRLDLAGQVGAHLRGDGGGSPAVGEEKFLYGIVDLYTGVPLFLGTYE